MAKTIAEKFAFTTVPNSLRKFLKGVPSRPVPPKVTQQHLKSIGLKSSNDRSMIPALKFVGLLDQSGAPTDTYRQFRDANAGPTVLAQSLRSAYKPLFDTYDDAYRQGDDALTNFFRANTSVGDRSVQYMVATFKTLSEFANFTASTPGDGSPPPSPGGKGRDSNGGSRHPELHVTFQIHLPQSNDPSVYDTIFDAMARSFKKLQ